VLVGDDDYTRKYPNDEYGAEMYPDARIWRAYNDERDIADKEYIDDNNATLDGILVFVSQATLPPTSSSDWDQGIHLLSRPRYLHHANIPGSSGGSSRNLAIIAC